MAGLISANDSSDYLRTKPEYQTQAQCSSTVAQSTTIAYVRAMSAQTPPVTSNNDRSSEETPRKKKKLKVQ
jgi:hypothetical protein